MGLKAIHFGGGNIGRGFVAEKLSLSGYEVRDGFLSQEEAAAAAVAAYPLGFVS